MVVDDFRGKLCLVTGGGSGIGQATCRMLAKYGGSVITADLNLKTAEETKAGLIGQINSHTAFQVDVSSFQSVRNLAEQILAHYKNPPSVIIHCAGIVTESHDTLDSSEDEWNKIIDTNLKGTFIINQTFLKLMKKSSVKGSFVNVASDAKYGSPKLVAYAASKAGVEGLTKSLAMEYGPEGFRFNCVSPSITRTNMISIFPEELVQNFAQHYTAKRPALPEEVASVCVFLASDNSSYVNATNIDVTSGKIA